jgi:ribonuclease HII
MMAKSQAEVLLNVSGNVKRTTPNLDEESALIAQGYRFIAGIDEAGRGALAGPVVAAAVILPPDGTFPRLKSVKDSKLVSPAKREELYALIIEESLSTGVGIVANDVIDSVNILNATKIAMRDAVSQLACTPDYMLIDGVTLTRMPYRQKCIVKGDRLCLTIACASIIAKVTRDRIMSEYHNLYPNYGFADHKGYGTEYHLLCLREQGPVRIHRYTFTPVKNTIAWI